MRLDMTVAQMDALVECWQGITIPEDDCVEVRLSVHAGGDVDLDLTVEGTLAEHLITVTRDGRA